MRARRGFLVLLFFGQEVQPLFDWVTDIVEAIGGTVSETVASMGEAIAESIFGAFLQWIYEIVFGAIADYFPYITSMGAELFDLDWVKAVILLFTTFGWALFVAGVVVAVFDTAIEYQNGRANIKSTAINILKGFFACSLIGVVPVELYKLCITLQNTFAHDLASLAGANAARDIGQLCSDVMKIYFDMKTGSLHVSLFSLLALIAFAYCVVKVFFQNIKRGGILLIQMTVGALYMFSVPRGYTDGFNQWMKQIAALCLTAFMQTTLLYLGLMTFKTSMLLGLGIMLAANEVPRIAQQFGLDSSVRVNMMSVFHASTTAVNLGRTIVKAFK